MIFRKAGCCHALTHVSCKYSSGRNTYTYADISPAERINYYRLKIIDKGGVFTNINLVRIDFSKQFTGYILPNATKLN